MQLTEQIETATVSWGSGEECLDGVTELRTEDELLAFLRSRPDCMVHMTMHTKAAAYVAVPRTWDWQAFVPLGSPAEALIELANDAGGNGEIDGGDPTLWASLPLRNGPWCGSFALPEHPDACREFPEYDQASE